MLFEHYAYRTCWYVLMLYHVNPLAGVETDTFMSMHVLAHMLVPVPVHVLLLVLLLVLLSVLLLVLLFSSSSSSWSPPRDCMHHRSTEAQAQQHSSHSSSTAAQQHISTSAQQPLRFSNEGFAMPARSQDVRRPIMQPS